MSLMIEVFYRAPADTHIEGNITHAAQVMGGEVISRTEPTANTPSDVIALTIEFPDFLSAQAAADHFRLEDYLVEGPGNPVRDSMIEVLYAPPVNAKREAYLQTVAQRLDGKVVRRIEPAALQPSRPNVSNTRLRLDRNIRITIAYADRKHAAMTAEFLRHEGMEVDGPAEYDEEK